MKALEPRCEWVKAHMGTASSEVIDRTLWEWYARSVPVRAAAGGMPRASEGPADADTARGRLAGVGLRGRPRGRQDAGRGAVDPAARRGGHDDAGLPDRTHGQRHP